MAVPHVAFEPDDPVAEPHLPGNAQFGKHSQEPVGGGLAYRLVLLLHRRREVPGRQMAFLAEEVLQNSLPAQSSL